MCKDNVGQHAGALSYRDFHTVFAVLQGSKVSSPLGKSLDAEVAADVGGAVDASRSSTNRHVDKTACMKHNMEHIILHLIAYGPCHS